MLSYAKKTALYILTTVVGSNIVALALRGEWTADLFWGFAITALGAVAVFFKTNTPDDPAAKFWIALCIPVLLAVETAITDHRFTADDVAPILVALVGALQVWAAGNVPETAVPAAEAETIEAGQG